MVGRIFLGRYEATRLLGEGGMGRVYLARQVDLGRQVVVKVMHDHIAADPKYRERFQREIKMLANFQHPYAVALYDGSLDDPHGPCIIMEYVRGVNLDALLAENGRFTPARVGRLLGQLCEVLQAAHDQQLIHRDLKPANLMVVDADSPREKLKVMDFGLAKTIDAATFKKITDTNVDFAIGTPGYICPEQLQRDDMDHRGDLYSVGVVVYELLAGRLPFPGPEVMDMLLGHATETPPTFAEIGLGDWVPEPVERVVMRCLAKDPAERPQSAAELCEAYEQALYAAESAPANPNYEAPLTGEMAPTAKPFATNYLAPSDDPSALLFTLEAWMPEKIAMVKLRGYVHDYQGQVVESVPGRIRVRLPLPESDMGSGPLSWFGLSGRKTGLAMEMHMQQTDPARENLLRIDVVFRAPEGRTQSQVWRARCTQAYINLRGYLMGSTESYN